MSQHYHVIGSLFGCMPSLNDVCTTKSQGKTCIAEHVKALRDSKNTLKGSVKEGYFELSKKTDSLIDYLSLEACSEEECLKELEN